MRIVTSSMVIFLALITCQSCFTNYSEDYYITLQNNSGKYVLPAYGLDYPVDSVDISTRRVIGPGEASTSTYGSGKLASWTWLFPEIQYISLFVFDGGLFDYEARGIRNYKDHPELVLLARYDLTLEDLERLHWECTYPPTEDMKNVHMFPPYPELTGQ